ncbi:nucleotidyltransferase family protein [Desulfatitalea alkaliphila]|uniref:Nucleotidyltransferase domain-containing protein n=1 Tax=Desulfatitalea alkaliphila TaxID=2929485 RepID=A0AA41R2Z1_9BACT|nr:nucleotidyltransferase domain-containing protein [Desulfatitalea alkaliphila]MCJ8502112.1 nucleotidyltransferase domain-containing protein [Desulfatitalea alkaliphila]
MKSKLTKDDILNSLRADKKVMQERFGVVEIGLFGSYATGNPNEQSDIDILIKLKEPRFEYLAGLQIFLERKFSKNIEITRKSDKINNQFIKKIEHQTIYV